jgi:hypothetical protein
MSSPFQPQCIAAIIREHQSKCPTIWPDLNNLPKALHGWPRGLVNRLHRDGVLRKAGKDYNKVITWDKGPRFIAVWECYEKRRT